MRPAATFFSPTRKNLRFVDLFAASWRAGEDGGEDGEKPQVPDLRFCRSGDDETAEAASVRPEKVHKTQISSLWLQKSRAGGLKGAAARSYRECTPC